MKRSFTRQEALDEMRDVWKIADDPEQSGNRGDAA